jgi:hypothetical protein
MQVRCRAIKENDLPLSASQRFDRDVNIFSDRVESELLTSRSSCPEVGVEVSVFEMRSTNFRRLALRVRELALGRSNATFELPP